MPHQILSAEDQKACEKFPVPLCVFSIDGDDCSLLAVSAGFCRAFQGTREMFSGPARELFRKYLHPEDLRHLRSDFESACLLPGGQYAAVYRIRMHEGTPYRWISGKGSIVRQGDGSCLLYVCFSDVNDETELHREEAASRQRQDVLFENILSTTKTSIFWKDADRRFLGANRAFLDYYGFADVGEILGKNDEDMGWHTEPDPYKNDELRVLRQGVSTYRVHGKCLARGQNRDIVASKSPLVADGRIVGLVGSFEDVTVETEQQAEIQRLNVELSAQLNARDLLMSISEVCIIKVNLADYTLLEYNDAMCRMIGCTPEEYEQRYHRRMEAFFAGEYQSELDGLKKIAADAIAQKKNRFTLNLRLPSVRGPIWVGGAASFADFDPDTKQPHSMYAVYRDITDNIEAQKKLELAEVEMRKAAMLEDELSGLRRMIDGVPAGIGALRITDGVPARQMQINQYFTERVGIVAGKDSAVDLSAFLDILHPDDRERMDREYHDFLRSKTLVTRQYRFRTVYEGYVWISVRATAIRLSDHTEIAYFTYTNINDLKNAEARLRESQRFYLEVIQAAKLSTWEYDIKNHSIRMSEDPHTKSTSSLLALPRVIRNVPDSLAALISPEDQPKFFEMYRKVAQGKNASCEVWYKPENGRPPRCERVTYIATDGPDGISGHAIGFSQNITAERKVEERYQRELGYLRQTDENKLLAKGRYNLTQNAVLEYSTKNDRIFRVEPGVPFDEAFRSFAAHAYDEYERGEILDKLDRSKLIERYQHGQMQTGLVYRRAREGQLPLWISMNIHTYMMPETGDLECFTYAYDITDERENDAIMGLIANEEFDYIGLIFVNSNEFEFIKKSAAIRFPDTHQRVSYTDCCDYVRRSFISDDERERFNAAVAAENIVAGLGTSGKHVTTYRRTESGKLLCKQLDYVWVDRSNGIVLVVRSDVTAAFERDREQIARIEAAKLEADRANEAKSSFLSSMSHDLRTPLSGVIGFTGLALKESDPEKKQEFLKKIDSSGKLLLDLVNDTLELSRIESGKAVLEQEIVMPNDLVPAVVTALRPSAELKGIHLEAEYENDETAPVWCDKLKIQKIALNLISNAIKYTPEGGTVSVRMVPAVTEGCRWSLCVEDNGIGMSQEFMQRMYEPFAQEKRSEAAKVPGTGLGLAIVKRYVDLMGGTIQVDSRLHLGTRWVVTLPVCEVPEGKVQKRAAEANMKQLSGKRVLLCEDNYMNTEIAVMLLKDKGVTVDAAENGAEGVRLFSASPEGYYAAVLMDLRMPVMDGNAAARKIRSLHRSDAGRIPIIAMTADAFEESVREARDAGMDGYVTKPIEPAKLFDTLSDAIFSRKGGQA